MDAVLDSALALRGVTGVLVLTRDSWLTIASRGALTANDAPAVERLLCWTEDDSTGSIPWHGSEGGSCLHFHRADTHTLILLRQHPGYQQRPESRASTGSGSMFGSFTPRAPRMRFGWSTTSTNSGSGSGSGVNDAFGFGLRAGSASLFAPSRSVESHNVRRPSSWY